VLPDRARALHPAGPPGRRTVAGVPEKVLSIVVVDGDPLAVRAITRTLAAEPDLKVVGTALEPADGLALVLRTAPDVVVLDVGPRDDEGLDLLQALCAAAPQPAVMVLSTLDDDQLALRCLRMGACGFLAKTVSIEVLPRIVRAVARGEAVLTRALTTKLVHRLREVPESDVGLRPVRSALSSREWEVLDLLRAGAGTRAIAEELEMAPETVRTHVKRILRKLDAHSREEAAERARQLVARIAA
jgi:two-component system, NarL family, response regulator LiaR